MQRAEFVDLLLVLATDLDILGCGLVLLAELRPVLARLGAYMGNAYHSTLHVGDAKRDGVS
jgi:hypothetical protein